MPVDRADNRVAEHLVDPVAAASLNATKDWRNSVSTSISPPHLQELIRHGLWNWPFLRWIESLDTLLGVKELVRRGAEQPIHLVIIGHSVLQRLMHRFVIIDFRHGEGLFAKREKDLAEVECNLLSNLLVDSGALVLKSVQDLFHFFAHVDAMSAQCFPIMNQVPQIGADQQHAILNGVLVSHRIVFPGVYQELEECLELSHRQQLPRIFLQFLVIFLIFCIEAGNFCKKSTKHSPRFINGVTDDECLMHCLVSKTQTSHPGLSNGNRVPGAKG